jgi:hypothetical protein
MDDQQERRSRPVLSTDAAASWARIARRRTLAALPQAGVWRKSNAEAFAPPHAIVTRPLVAREQQSVERGLKRLATAPFAC